MQVDDDCTHEYFILKNGGEQKGEHRHEIAEYELLQRPPDSEFRQERVQDAIERQDQQKCEQGMDGLHLVGFDFPTDVFYLTVHQRRLQRPPRTLSNIKKTHPCRNPIGRTGVFILCRN